MNIIGLIFWIFIAVKIGGSIGKGLNREINSASYKSYMNREQKIARKYGDGYPVAHVQKHKHGEEAYSKYKQEVDELKKKCGY